MKTPKKTNVIRGAALGLALAALACPAARAMPAEILLLRHGEKPDSGPDLSAQGWERAKALPAFFHNRAELQPFGLPAALFAMSPDREEGSKRALETLQYVSQDLNLPIRSDFTRGQESELVAAIRADASLNGKFVVICWEHRSMTPLAAALGVQPAPRYPDNRFDLAWLAGMSGDQVASFRILPEQLLPGDGATAGDQ